MSADHSHLLLHDDVQWLSKGNALKRVCDLRKEIITFLHGSKQMKANMFLSLMLVDGFVSNMCLLHVMFHHLNPPNLLLHGRKKTAVDIVESLTAFQMKLVCFSSELTDRMFHFPTLCNFIKSSTSKVKPKVTQLMTAFIDTLRGNFAQLFDDFDMPRELGMVNHLCSWSCTQPTATQQSLTFI